MTSICLFSGKLLILYGVLSLTCVCANALNFGNIPRVKRQASNCGFKCTDGQCISDDLVCDGKENCKDGSDEGTFCKTLSCPEFLFRCNYGACIAKSKVCNGKTDCRDNSDEPASCGNSNPIKAGNCSKNQFACGDGKCLGSDKVCNGVADCADKSDEQKELCSTIACPGYTYRCDYGACVSGRAKCNGIQECLDNSDEDPKKCGGKGTTKKPVTDPTPQVTTELPPFNPNQNYCTLPNPPENGFWELASGDTSKKPGQGVADSTVIFYKCKNRYKLVPEGNISLCLGNKWEPNLRPQCLRTCQTFESTETTKLNCALNNRYVSCHQPIDGTVLTYTCNPYYEPESTRTSNIRVCRDGIWNLPKPVCYPKCGQEFVRVKPLIVNGTEVPRGKYPWQAAIYLKSGSNTYQNICGGSMLNQRVIITAAHCVTDLGTGKKLPKENYEIAVGKYYNQYYDTRDIYAQFSKLFNIYVPEEYSGAKLRFQADMALLVTEKKLEFSDFVQPICFDTANNIYLSDGDIGVVAGWGYTEEGGKPSDVLKELAIPLERNEVCRDHFPPDWQDQYFLPDKLCAGYYNRSLSVCRGDSGGALAFRHTDKRYYIHGIVSISTPSESLNVDSCNKQQYSLFTKISKYISYVSEVASIAETLK